MPLDRVELRPGINTMASPTLNTGGYSDASLVRFKGGLPEKWGGWTRFQTSLVTGKARTLLAFAQLAGDKMLAIGTHNHLYISRGGGLTDVTPVDTDLTTGTPRTYTVAAAGISTSVGTPNVAVTLTGTHSIAVGDFITFDTISGTGRTASGVTVGGIALSGDYQVTGIGASTFQFAAASNAASTATGGGAATVTCFLPAGQADRTPGLGWGAGGWGVTAWNMPSTVAATTLPLRIVSLDAWGQSALAVPTQERLFAWSPDASGNITTRFQAVVNSGTPSKGPPQRNGQVLVGSPERHAILFGCSSLNSTLNYDPMLVRWSDVEDYTVWLASSTNSAGSFRLQGGTEIVGAYNGNQQTLIWTDSALHTMRFIGLPYVYSFSKVAQNCGLIAQRAHTECGGAVYWMGTKGFWRFQGGSPELIPCTMLAEVFSRLNPQQRAKVTAGTNTANGEVLWFYPADGATENTRYVAYNTIEGVWYGGALARTVWIDNEVFDTPLACDPNGQVWQQENGTDADGQPMGEFLQTGYWDMGEGEQIIFASQIMPDFRSTAAGAQSIPVNVTFFVQDYPNGRVTTRGPYLLGPTTKTRGFRARGRQMAMRIEGVGTGGSWRLGALRVNYQPDGQR